VGDAGVLLRELTTQRLDRGDLVDWGSRQQILSLLEDSYEGTRAAALWEVVWRVEPALGHLPGSTETSPNPFLATAESGPTAISRTVRDPDAARLLQLAFDVERDEVWPNARSIAERYVTSMGQFLPGLGGEAWSESQGDREHWQAALTRLLLLGRPETTEVALTAHCEVVAVLCEGNRDAEDIVRHDFIPILQMGLERLPVSPRQWVLQQLVVAVQRVVMAVDDREVRRLIKRSLRRQRRGGLARRLRGLRVEQPRTSA